MSHTVSCCNGTPVLSSPITNHRIDQEGSPNAGAFFPMLVESQSLLLGVPEMLPANIGSNPTGSEGRSNGRDLRPKTRTAWLRRALDRFWMIRRRLGNSPSAHLDAYSAYRSGDLGSWDEAKARLGRFTGRCPTGQGRCATTKSSPTTLCLCQHDGSQVHSKRVRGPFRPRGWGWILRCADEPEAAGTFRVAGGPGTIRSAVR